MKVLAETEKKYEEYLVKLFYFDTLGILFDNSDVARMRDTREVPNLIKYHWLEINLSYSNSDVLEDIEECWEKIKMMDKHEKYFAYFSKEGLKALRKFTSEPFEFISKEENE